MLAQMQKEMSLERVEKLMDQSREGVEYQREIDEALASTMSPEEEEEVQRELAALEAEHLVRLKLSMVLWSSDGRQVVQTTCKSCPTALWLVALLFPFVARC